MNSDDDDRSHGHPSYIMTEKQRDFLRSGGQGNSRLADTIREKKVERLPELFDLLRADIYRYSEEGYLAADEWEDTWRELMSIDGSSDSEGYASNFRYVSSEGAVKNPPASEQWGRHLGQITSRLMLVPDGVDEEELFMQVVYGFTKALCPNLQSQADEFQYAQRTAEYIEKLSEFEIGWRERAVHAYRDHPGGWTNFRGTFDNRAEEVLKQTHIEPSTWLLTELHGIVREKLFQSDPEEREFAFEEDLTVDETLTLIEENRLEEKQRLAEPLKSDAEKLKAKKPFNTHSAAEILMEIPPDRSISSSELAAEDRLDEHVNRVTRAAKDMAGIDCGERGERGIAVWSDRPPVEGAHSSGRWQWQKTAYGNALTYVLEPETRRGSDDTPLHAIPSELLDCVVDEVELSDER